MRRGGYRMTDRLFDPVAEIASMVWCVRRGNRWTRLRAVDVQIPLQTVYRGPRSAQPRAYLAGHGRLLMTFVGTTAQRGRLVP